MALVWRASVASNCATLAAAAEAQQVPPLRHTRIQPLVNWRTRSSSINNNNDSANVRGHLIGHPSMVRAPLGLRVGSAEAEAHRCELSPHCCLSWAAATFKSRMSVAASLCACLRANKLALAAELWEESESANEPSKADESNNGEWRMARQTHTRAWA